MDVNDMKIEDNKFNVVVDKGTLDAMMSSEEGDNAIEKAFKEITRILKDGGRYLVLSLAQDNVLQHILDYFSSHKWLIRIHKVSLDECSSTGEWRMPLYLFVFIKVSVNIKLIEICLDDNEKPKRLNDKAEAKKIIKEQQYYAMIRNNLASKGPAKDLPEIELFSSDDDVNARYSIRVIDCKTNRKPFGIFIVPQGQEHTWMGSKEGQQDLAKSAGFGRLAVVYLNRNHSYENEDKCGMDLIKAELSSKIMQLAPISLPKQYKTPFLSSGETLGHRYVRAQFEVNEKSVVIEDYKAVASNSNTSWCRRIVYQDKLISLPAAVITEIGLKASNSKSKMKRNKKTKKLPKSDITNVKDVDPSKIYYKPNQYVFGLVARKKSVLKSSMKVCYLGLESGLGLVNSVAEHFTNTHNTVIEKDEQFFKIVQKLFSINDKSKFIDIILSGPNEFLAENSTVKYDVIVANCRLDTENNFYNMDYSLITSSLKPDGLFILNLISSNDCDLNLHYKSEDFQTIKGHFASVHTYYLKNAGRMVVACEMVSHDYKTNFLDVFHGKTDVNLTDLYSNLSSGVKR